MRCAATSRLKPGELAARPDMNAVKESTLAVLASASAAPSAGLELGRLPAEPRAERDEGREVDTSAGAEREDGREPDAAGTPATGTAAAVGATSSTAASNALSRRAISDAACMSKGLPVSSATGGGGGNVDASRDEAPETSVSGAIPAFSTSASNALSSRAIFSRSSRPWDTSPPKMGSAREEEDEKGAIKLREDGLEAARAGAAPVSDNAAGACAARALREEGREEDHAGIMLRDEGREEAAGPCV